MQALSTWGGQETQGVSPALLLTGWVRLRTPAGLLGQATAFVGHRTWTECLVLSWAGMEQVELGAFTTCTWAKLWARGEMYTQKKILQVRTSMLQTCAKGLAECDLQKYFAWPVRC